MPTCRRSSSRTSRCERWPTISRLFVEGRGEAVISIPLIRRQLANDLLGRHIYLFGRAGSSTAILRQLADAGAQEGTVVLAEDAGARVSVAALLRQSLPI